MLMDGKQLNKLKHLKAALDGRAATQIKGLDESDPAKAFTALRDRLLGHFGPSDEAQSARRKFKNRLQSEDEAVDEFVDALLKLNRAGWPGSTLEQRGTELQDQFVGGLRLTELQEYLRLQCADLGFEATVKKARRYVEIKDTSKPRKASVRFASAERDPAVNVITSSHGGFGAGDVLSQRHSEPHGQDGTWPTASATADSAQSFYITCAATVDRQPAGQIVSIFADRQHRQPLRTVRGPRRCAAAELLYQPATVPSPDTTGRMERCQLPTSDTGMERRRTTFSGDATMVDQSWPEVW